MTGRKSSDSLAGVRLKRRFSLDFPRFVRRMALESKLHRWQCVAT